MPPARDLKVVIVGAGFGGIAAAIELRGHGFRDLMILDRAAELGGTWLHNNYPGAACDVPSHLYSFSFAQRRDWTRMCSPRDEILDYLRGVAREYGVDRLVTGRRRGRARARGRRRRWTVTSADGRTGTPTRSSSPPASCTSPPIPRIEGRETFAGHSFHSAGWDHDYDLRGKRVAVIGTGASAVQFVPEIAEVAERLVVFQRAAQLVPAAPQPPLPGADQGAHPPRPGRPGLPPPLHLPVRRDR